MQQPYSPLRLMILVVFLPFLLLACGKTNTDMTPLPADETASIDISTRTGEIEFNDDELDYIKSLRDRGYISIGGMKRKDMLELAEDGSYSGIKYDLAKGFADFLDVELRMKQLEFKDYFARDGIIPPELKTDPYLSYAPDVFGAVDIVGDFLTVLPWRLKAMNMIPLLPNKEMFVCRSDDPLTGFGQLKGKKIGFIPESSYEYTLKAGLDQAGVEAELVPLTFEDDAYHMVASGELDGFLEDSQHLFRNLKDYPDLQPGFVASDLSHLGWATSRDDEILVGLIQKFFAHANDSGMLNDTIRRYISVDLETYYSLIGFESGKEVYQLGLNATEREWLDSRIQEGSLRIATIESEDNYLRLDDGTIIGFDYILAKSLAETLGLNLDVQAFNDISPFFAFEGNFDQAVMMDPSISYSPTLFEEVDIYCVPFSVSEWREKLVRFVRLYPVSISLAGRRGEEIRTITDLDGRSVAVIRGSYQEGLMRQVMEEEGISIELVYIDSRELPLAFVAEGGADFALDAATPLINGLKNHDNLVVSPVAVMKTTTGWAVQRNDAVMASILTKYIALSMADGSFGDMWSDSYGVDFDEYMDFVGG